MKSALLIKNSFFILILFFSSISFALVPSWKIIADESSINFTATQNGAPVSGKFTKFEAEIVADPAALEQSHVLITVDTASVSTSYKDLTMTLLTPEWFNTALFPHAVLKADHFKKVGDNTYQADGSLTLRDKTQAFNFNFSVKEISQIKTRVSGSFILKRNDFGVGQGEWMNTQEIKDEVTVNFVITAEKVSR